MLHPVTPLVRLFVSLYSRCPWGKQITLCLPFCCWPISVNSMISIFIYIVMNNGCLSFLWLTSILSCMIFTTHFYGDGFTFIWFAGFWGEGENSSVWRSFSLSRFVELFSIINWKNCFTFFIVSFWNSHDVCIGLLDNTQGYRSYLYSLLFLSS